MIEHTSVIDLIRDPEDINVELCLCKNGTYMHWENSPPDEFIYIPETIFQKIAGPFCKKLDRDYHSTIGLGSELCSELINCLNAFIQEKNTDPVISKAAKIIKEFIIYSQEKSTTHYIAFEGP